MQDIYISEAGGIKHPRSPNAVVWLVTPEGRIKDVEVSTTLHSPLLDVTFEEIRTANGPPRPKRVIGIRLSQYAISLGYRLLRDLYEEEGMPEGFDIYVQWVKDSRELQVSKPISNDYLPEAVIARARRAANPEVTLPPSPKKVKSADEGADAPAPEAPTQAPKKKAA